MKRSNRQRLLAKFIINFLHDSMSYLLADDLLRWMYSNKNNFLHDIVRMATMIMIIAHKYWHRLNHFS